MFGGIAHRTDQKATQGGAERGSARVPPSVPNQIQPKSYVIGSSQESVSLCGSGQGTVSGLVCTTLREGEGLLMKRDKQSNSFGQVSKIQVESQVPTLGLARLS